ncbi:MAG: hypothetical protein ABIH66_13300 [bacterium]
MWGLIRKNNAEKHERRPGGVFLLQKNGACPYYLMEKMKDGESVALCNFQSEIFPVQAGLRPTAILEIPSRLLKLHFAYFQQFGIYYKSRSMRFCIKTKKMLSESYTLYGPEDDPYFVYIGLNNLDVIKIMKADIMNDSLTAGKLLGYPECCVLNFQIMKAEKHILGETKKNTNI